MVEKRGEKGRRMTECSRRKKGRHRNGCTVNTKREKVSRASTLLRSIEAINTSVEYIDQEHLSHLPFEVEPNAAGFL